MGLSLHRFRKFAGPTKGAVRASALWADQPQRTATAAGEPHRRSAFLSAQSSERATHQYRILDRAGDALERRFNAWAPAICRQQDDEDDDDYFDLPVCQDAQGKMRISQGAVNASRIGQPGNPHEVSRTIYISMGAAI